jgi:hypothetical protein
MGCQGVCLVDGTNMGHVYQWQVSWQISVLLHSHHGNNLHANNRCKVVATSAVVGKTTRKPQIETPVGDHSVS